IAQLEACVDIAWSHLRHRGRLVRDYVDVPQVRGNGARVAQVLLNLLVNAAQSLDEGAAATNEVTLRVSCSGAIVTVSVRDNGSGIAPNDLPRIFDPFFTTKPVGIGTGLGLFVCHGIVKALGGEVEVESTLGSGTTVRVMLPVANAHRPLRAPGPVE